MQSLWADVRGAFAFLTVLPIPWPESSRPGRTLAYYPLVGLAIGAAVAGVAALDGLPDGLRSFLALAGWVILTGGLHLDGFGDACDGLLATVEPARRLEIMKDPQAGSWAVIGLILLLLGKWTALGAVEPVRLILPPVIGRWAMVLAVAGFPYARASGLGSFFRDGFGRAQVAIASLTALIICAAYGPPVMLSGLAGPALAWAGGHWAARRLGGGLTGDVYGALCELTELVCLILLGSL
mgnify:CR=1 FL=1